jgi:hypothetical protein
MELLLVRCTKTESSTIGALQVDGEYQCFTLEDKDRGLTQGMGENMIKSVKVAGKTAIPTGRYRVVLSWSNRFQKYMPELLNVPGFAGIRIHSGNTAVDTEGCILVGEVKGDDVIYRSRLAYMKLLHILQDAEKNQSVFITIN